MFRFGLGIGILAVLAGCGSTMREPVAPPPLVAEQAERVVDPDFARAYATLATFPRYGDSDPHDWESREPWAYPIHGIDVARYQGDIDWQEVRKSGVSFAWIKATEGGDHLDETFKSNWRGAKRAGLRRGAYHFYYFCRSPEEQARWYIRNVPKDPNGLPPVLDIEWNHASPSCKRRPSGVEARHEAERFLKKIEAHYGRRPVIYTTVDFYRDTGIGRLNGVDFWLRSVAGHPQEVYPSAHWAFWQYTGTGTVPGIDGDVDLNVFAGSAESWLSWLGYRKYLPVAEPAQQTITASN
ncbi:GH25 family lysozyme [Phaeobacter sp. HF9A]|uniref:glycoside hydrolase family 25 protein n=1 Tax=Phaeobacter sp. HF9A TaxID=2721561 RepID=UPI001431A545|nr:GH25 family lysozyme [Phaeobacter sp. HF9A]NIZ13669.1 glycoside hydrolase family 25 protein [Phaeobacter sp. HF9A]